MSSTFSNLVTDVLLDHCRQATSSTKYLIRGVMGVSSVSLYASLVQRTNADVAVPVGPDDQRWTMRAARLGAVVVVPYLVRDGHADPDDPNRGNRGFNGRLRDWFDRDERSADTAILVTFDSSPIETQITAMDGTLERTLFTSDRLLDHIAATSAGNASIAIRRTLDDVLNWSRGRVAAAEDITALLQFVNGSAPLSSIDEVGHRLVSLPWLLRDPDLGPRSVTQRLNLAAEHRTVVDGWSRSPDVDFAEQARGRYKDELATRLITERRLGFVRWEKFTLGELEAGRRTRWAASSGPPVGFNDAKPVSVPSAVAEVFKLTSVEEPRVYAHAALVRPGADSVRVSLNRELREREALHVIEYDRTAEGPARRRPRLVAAAHDSDDVELLVTIEAAPLETGWRFLDIVLTNTPTYRTRFVERLRVGLLTHSELTTLPYEAELRIDPELQAFSVADRLAVELVDAGGGISVPDAEPEEQQESTDTSVEHVPVTVDGYETLLPIAFDLGDPEAADGGIAEEWSPEHAVLRFIAQSDHGFDEVGAPRLTILQTGARVRLGGQDRSLPDIADLGASRWSIEAAVLEAPNNTAYRTSSLGALVPDVRLESLDMGSVQSAFDAFLSCRVAFFAAVRAAAATRVPSVLAVDLTEIAETPLYLRAYQDLLHAIPDGASWRAEFERVLMVDAVSPDGIDAAYIAPTNPLSVALHLQFQSSMQDWASEETWNLLPVDADLISPRYLLPVLQIAGELQESRHTAYPWRRYSPVALREIAEPEPYTAAFIARRIEAFLEVHPIYRHRDRTLSLVFVNPGAATHVKEALHHVLQRAARTASQAANLDAIPRFELRLVSGERAYGASRQGLGSSLDNFMTSVQESGAPGWLDVELMRRLTYTKGSLSEYISSSTAFAHLTFVEQYFASDYSGTYRIDDHASSLYGRGLAPDLERRSEIQANDVVFTSGIWLGAGSNSVVERLVRRSLEIAAAARVSEVRSGRALGALTTVRKAEVPELYRRSVWVIHMDRNVGLELFYPQAQGADSPYILDYTDQENVHEAGFDGITATAMVRPYLARIEAVFAPLVPVDEVGAELVLRWLNILSGRWALELLRDSAFDSRERLAAVVAFRLLAVRERVFDDRDVLAVVVSLDELIRITPKERLSLKAGWAAQFGHTGETSDDFLLLRVPLTGNPEPVITGRLIEVKYEDAARRTDKAWRQLKNSHSLVSRLFVDADYPGRLFRARTLARLVDAYAARLAAYGLVSPGVQHEPRYREVLDRVGRGEFTFDLAFERGGQSLIGDFISVEPRYSEPIYAGEPYGGDDDASDALIGRVRIGPQLIHALIADNALEAQGGDYELPTYPGSAGTPRESASEESRRADADDAPDEATGDGGSQDERRTDEASTGQRDDGATAEDDVPIAAGEAAAHPGMGEAAPQLLGSGSGAGEEGKAPPTPLMVRLRVDSTELRSRADKLDRILGVYGLPVHPFDPELAEVGPNSIRFRARMGEGGTIAAVESRSRDIQRELGVSQPIFIGQDPPYIAVDIPRDDRAIVRLGDVAGAVEAALGVPGQLPFVLGVDASARPCIQDLAQLPHLLVAGRTYSGKSVFLRTIGTCLTRIPADRLELVLVDIKGVDFGPFSTLPHLREGKIIEDPAEAVETLEKLITDEVAERRALLREFGASQVTALYAIAPPERWPKQVVVMIDEYAQLVTAAGAGRGHLEQIIQQYAQFARAFGIYLVLATQRPSADVITGRVKANLPARCVFNLPSFNDSRTVIDVGGAERLLGSGDMLFYRDGSLTRYQAVLTETDDMTSFWRR